MKKDKLDSDSKTVTINIGMMNILFNNFDLTSSNGSDGVRTFDGNARNNSQGLEAGD